MSTTNGTEGTDLGQKVALAVGAAFSIAGLAGFLVTGFDDFFGKTGETLVGFEVNGFHNVVHLLIGAAGLAMWRRVGTARLYGWLLFAGYSLVFLYGLFVVNGRDGNFLSLNSADNVLHIVSALTGLGIALVTGRRGSVLDASGRSVSVGSSVGR